MSERFLFRFMSGLCIVGWSCYFIGVDSGKRTNNVHILLDSVKDAQIVILKDIIRVMDQRDSAIFVCPGCGLSIKLTIKENDNNGSKESIRRGH